MQYVRTTLMAVLFALSTATGLAYSGTMTQYGDTVYDSDGTQYTQYGDTVYGSNGKTYTQYGDTVYGSDGSQYTKYGDTVYYDKPDEKV